MVEKNVTQEEVAVNVTEVQAEPIESKGEKAKRVIKNGGRIVWKATKTTCAVVGALVLGSICAGFVLGKKDSSTSNATDGSDTETLTENNEPCEVEPEIEEF